MSEINRVLTAISELKSGKPIILIDHPDRENEGDLVIAAECITARNMNFIIRHTSGIVCLSLTAAHLKKLNLPQMVPCDQNTSLRGTPFSVSIDSKNGITTGVSAADRVTTILNAIADDATPNDIVTPGHIFPLQAREGGVLERQGHTEGALDLVRLAGFKPAAVLCEIMNPDGSMTRGKELIAFAKEHDLFILSISDLITYRLQTENLIIDEATTILPIDSYGTFQFKVIKEKMTGDEHLVLSNLQSQPKDSTLVRIHSSCKTGDLFASKRCDCYMQLHHSLKRIQQEGGILIYLNQEGRGIGLINKIKAYALQEQGFDTVDANLKLGLPADAREYYIAANVLRNLNIFDVRLLTNNMTKVTSLEKYGIQRVQREPMPVFQNEQNQYYLQVKKEKLNQVIHFE